MDTSADILLMSDCGITKMSSRDAIQKGETNMNAGEVVRAMLDAITEGDDNRSAAAFAEDSQIIAVPMGRTFRGPEGWNQFVQLWRSVASGIHLEITNLFATEDQVLVEYVSRGFHTGNVHSNYASLGHSTVAASEGQPFEVSFCHVYHIEHGEITNCSDYYDVLSLMRPATSLSQEEPIG